MTWQPHKNEDSNLNEANMEYLINPNSPPFLISKPFVMIVSTPPIKGVECTAHLTLWPWSLIWPREGGKRDVVPVLSLSLKSQEPQGVYLYWLWRSPGEGNGSYSCLENPMDRGAWWATVHVVKESWTQLTVWAHCTSAIAVRRTCPDYLAGPRMKDT